MYVSFIANHLLVSISVLCVNSTRTYLIMKTNTIDFFSAIQFVVSYTIFERNRASSYIEMIGFSTFLLHVFWILVPLLSGAFFLSQFYTTV